MNKVCRICDGIYDADVPTDQRLLYWTRPVMEEFALTVEEMCPCEQNRYEKCLTTIKVNKIKQLKCVNMCDNYLTEQEITIRKSMNFDLLAKP